LKDKKLKPESMPGLERKINKLKNILEELKRIGFEYVAVDLEGYRSGSMDEPWK
jgi:uncharacterized protein